MNSQKAAVLDQDGALAEEFKELGINGDQQTGDDNHTALCLSGGGIRSATFCLGVLQGLARHGGLKRFRYLSTVSGGGYIGGWLSRWIHDEQGNTANVEAALAAAAPPQPISNLRAYGNYLSPVWGLSVDTFTLVAIYLRNLLLNWAILLPLIGVAVLLPRLFAGLVAVAPSPGLGWAALGIGIAAYLLNATYAAREENSPSPGPDDGRFLRYGFLPLLAACISLTLAAAWAGPTWSRDGIWPFVGAGVVIQLAAVVVGTSLSGPAARPAGKKAILIFIAAVVQGGVLGALVGLAIAIFHPTEAAPSSWLANPPPAFALLAVPAVLSCVWLSNVVRAALDRFLLSDGDVRREWSARASGWGLRFALAWVFVFGITLYLPAWIIDRPEVSPTSLAAAGGAWGLVIALFGYWTRHGATIARQSRAVATRIGLSVLDLAALAFAVALLVGASLVAHGSLPSAPTMPPATAKAAHGDLDTVVEQGTATGRQIEAAAPALSSPAREGGRERLLSIAKQVDTAARASEASCVDNLQVALTAIACAEAALDGKARPGAPACRAPPSVGGPATAIVAGALSRAIKIQSPNPGRDYVDRFSRSDPGPVSAAIATLLLIAGVFASLCGPNTFSLHHLYGNRLVRAYLGAARSKRDPHSFTGFDPKDNIKLKEVHHGKKQPLFHVVTAALNLFQAAGNRREWQQRKAASFTFTPLYSGSSETGYRPSERYFGESLSLGRAMTISGAAASPNMGYHTSLPVAFAMSVFNLRLGWWLTNRDVPSSWTGRLGSSLDALKLRVKESFALTSASGSHVYLSDGGHFDNLGLYEMIRRRCRRIVVLDASADPQFGFDDLQETIRKVRVDLGVETHFFDGPPNATRRCTIARIHYGAPHEGWGWLYYLKPVVLGDEPVDVLHYAAASRRRDRRGAFPHQSTADQCFDEAQFESYRRLGLHTAEAVFGPTGGSWPAGNVPPTPPDGSGNLPPSPPLGGSGEAPSGDDRAFEIGKKLVESAGAETRSSLAQAAIVASAITVGGAVGVGGTVALQNATVSLQPATVSLQPATVSLQPATVSLQPVTVSLHSGQTVGIDQQNVKDGIRINLPEGGIPVKATLEATALKDGIRINVPKDAIRVSATLEATALQEQITTIGERLAAVDAVVKLRDLWTDETKKKIEGKMDDLDKDIAQLRDSGPERDKEDLKKLAKRLDDIKTAVRGTP